MKRLSTISLWLSGVIVSAIIVAGLLSYQNNKNINKVEVSKVTPPSGLLLNMAEISKHNKQTDCWLLIDGKVYDITSYFGSHPGGNSVMSFTCGKDATNAYKTQDPYASSSGSRSAHSSKAKSYLNNYYIGDFIN